MNLEKCWFILRGIKSPMNETKSSTLTSLRTVGIPIIIQYMLTASIGLIASFLAGSLGDRSVAALGIGNQIFFVYSLVVLGLFAGAGVLMAQLYGNRDLKNIKRVIIISGTIGTTVGVVFLLLEKTFVSEIAHIFTSDREVVDLVKQYMDVIIYSYLILPFFLAMSAAFRATHRSAKPMQISLFAVVVNVVLSYGLIYGKLGLPEYGLAGIGVATICSRGLELLLMFLAAQKSDLRITWLEFSTVSPETAFAVMRTAGPVIINELCWGMGMVIYNILYGYIGLESLTAIQMNSVLQNFFMTLVFGASGATAIIVGNLAGAGDSEVARDASKTIIRLAVPVSILTGLAMIGSAHLVLPLYNVSAITAKNFLTITFIAGVMMPVKFYAVLMITGVLRGGGDTVYTMYLELATMWLVGVPIALITVLVLHLPVYMAFGLVFVEDLLKCVLTYERYSKGKWITNLTDVFSSETVDTVL